MSEKTHTERMGSHSHNVAEDHEALIYQTPYPCAYYVQSPSTLSHANSATDIRNIQNDADSSLFHSPIRSETHPSNPTHIEDPSRCFALTRYSSSRGSSHSFLHHKKISYDDGRSHGTATESGDANRLIIVDGDDHGGDDDDDDEYDDVFDYGKRRERWKRYFSYNKSDSCVWILLQISWRLLLSFGVALLVFYLSTKPPPPNVSIEISRIREFKLAEGVDRTGVTTKILTCNCSMDLIIENKSKFFGVHIRPPIIDMSFGSLPLALSHGQELYAESGLAVFKLLVGTENKPMYGAGRSMQDMLDSGRGLRILIHVSLTSTFKVVPNLINPKFHHHVKCSILLNNAYDKKHGTQKFKSSCISVTS